MSRVAGFTVLVLGLGFGGYVYYPELAQYDADARNAAERLVKEDRAPAEPLVVPASAPRDGRTFSPQSPLFAPAPGASPAAPLKSAQPTAPQPAAMVEARVDHEHAATPDKAAGGGDAAAWSATVTPAAAESNAGRSGRPRDEASRAKLARDLQHELKRVGCYEGEVDGSWGPGSRRAMNAFTERVNATLPVDEPDYILLTLVQGHRAAACGKSCPAGQVLSNDRCLPQSVVAQAERKSKRTATATAVADSRATAKDAGRGAVPPAMTRTAEVEGKAAREPRRSDEPLPGRMSIGGPDIPVLKTEPRRATPPPSRMAAAQPEAAGSATAVPASPIPVTGAAPAARVPAPAAREAASVERLSRPVKAAPVRHEPRVVRHAPEPRYVQRPQGPAFSSKSRRMIYDLYQRPDRIN